MLLQWFYKDYIASKGSFFPDNDDDDDDDDDESNPKNRLSLMLMAVKKFQMDSQSFICLKVLREILVL